MNRTSSVLCASALTATAGLLIAGPLSPPAGPVASTFKTLSETEPRTAISAANTPGDADSVFRITAPGSYYLTGNIAGGASGKAGIEIAASGVTIDLAGFTLDGSVVLGLPGSLDGIRAVGSIADVTIRNGTVRDWNGDGLDLVAVTGLVVSDVIVDSCTGVGMYPGLYARVERSHFLYNGEHGLFISAPGASIRDCTAALNGGSGVRITGIGARVERCTIQSNHAHGIDLSTQCVVEDNLCTFNGTGIADGSGIRITGTGARVVRNHTTSNDKGIAATNDNNIVYQNWASQNSVQNFEFTGSGGFGSPRDITNGTVSLEDAMPYRNFEYAP